MTMPPVGPRASVFVRPATGADAGFLADAVLVTARADGRSAEGDLAALTAAALAEIDDPDRSLSVVEVDGERAGRMDVERAPSYLLLRGLQLLPAHQGQGIGTHLVEQLLVEARGVGLRARLRVESDNPRARALYERLGFTEVLEDDPNGPGDPVEAVVLEWREPVRG